MSAALAYSRRAVLHLTVALPFGAGACRPARVPSLPRTGAELIDAALRAWPTADATTRLAVTTASATRVSIYDNALVALLLSQRGRRLEAGRLLEALAILQRPDGAMPFSFDAVRWRDADPYVRSGALAWVGYAGVAYLNADRDGPARGVIVRMLHGLARYLMDHQIEEGSDPRAGLVTGGYGDHIANFERGVLEQRFVPRAIGWASTEHNVDAFFFFRSLARMTGQQEYAVVAERIAAALARTAWSAELGQFGQGVSQSDRDTARALDCASWGALFLLAIGDEARARIALDTVERRYRSRDPWGHLGYKPYASGPIVSDASIAEAHGLAFARWDSSDAVWPEGSAGVALAVLRLGDRARARAILTDLDALRDGSGALPTMTLDVPFEFDGNPSLAATTWVELVREELDHPERSPWLWAR